MPASSGRKRAGRPQAGQGVRSEPSPAEREAIDAALARLLGDGPPPRAGAGRRDLVLPLLQVAQAEAGWCSPGAIDHIAARLRVPPTEVFGVASFYSLLATRPQGRLVIRVCDDVPCWIAGSDAIVAALSDELGIRPGESTADLAVKLETVPCLGACDRAPYLLAGEADHGPLTPEEARAIARRCRHGHRPA